MLQTQNNNNYHYFDDDDIVVTVTILIRSSILILTVNINVISFISFITERWQLCNESSAGQKAVCQPLDSCRRSPTEKGL